MNTDTLVAVVVVVCTVLCTLGIVSLAVVLSMKHVREMKKRRTAARDLMNMSPESRELHMISVVQQKAANELWEVPLSERPFLVTLAHTPKGQGQMVMMDPDQFKGWKGDWRTGAGERALRLIGTALRRIEEASPNANAIDTLISILEAEQHELAKRPQQPIP